jgi:glycosyltransferase involved in cell wall biosynthesis
MLLRMTGQWGRDFLRKPHRLRRIVQETETLLAAYRQSPAPYRLDLSAPPLYLRTDLIYGLRSGGSVGHIAGVLNHLAHFTGNPVMFTTDRIPTVREDLETHLLPPPPDFWDFAQMPALSYTEFCTQRILALWGDRKPAFVYQRYCLDNYAGVRVARALKIPFVLEYNGSELWISKNWGRGLKLEAVSERIERLNLAAADVVVVVSKPMREELVARGVAAEKILVNPNGVDPERYSPTVDGSAIRQKHGLQGKTVIGFIGTFGPWHGAEKLAQAFGQLLRAHPEYRETARLLLIGDGVKRPEVEAALEEYNARAQSILTGLVPQEEGPAYLAACDLLASPHVPNSDGTPFFGSPTKLFEYMAMGKGIVASDLDQIGEVLSHDQTAWMVEPGDSDALLQGLKTLLDDAALRERLGNAAREEALRHYTWQAHTARIIAALEARCPR